MLPPASRCHINFLVTLALLLFAGCDKQIGEVIDPTGVPPFVRNASVKPDSIRMTSLPQNNGLLTVTADARVHATHPSGQNNIARVTAEVISSSSSDPVLSVELRDDGVGPDSIAGDGSYAATLKFTISRYASGIYRIRFVAVDQLGFDSNLLDVPLVLVRDNQPPTISDLVAPDTITIPSGSTATFGMNLRATDPDGQGDITQVYFRSLDSSDPTRKFFLRDDGAALSGDAVEGDGIFSIIVQVPDAGTVRKTYRFAFQATDTFGDTSATIIHRLTIQ